MRDEVQEPVSQDLTTPSRHRLPALINRGLQIALQSELPTPRKGTPAPLLDMRRRRCGSSRAGDQ